MASVRVKLYRTRAEWDVIQKKMTKRNLSSFMRSEIKKIAEKYSDCPLCVTEAKGEEIEGCKIEKQCEIDAETYAIFEEIADKMQKPVASVIDDFIIVPLLTP
jgi:hypothetical protein